MVYSHKGYFLLVLCLYHMLAVALLHGVSFLGPRMLKQPLYEYCKSHGRREEVASHAWALRTYAQLWLCDLGSHSIGQRKSVSHS